MEEVKKEAVEPKKLNFLEEKGKENPEDKAIRIRLDKKRTKQPEER